MYSSKENNYYAICFYLSHLQAILRSSCSFDFSPYTNTSGVHVGKLYREKCLHCRIWEKFLDDIIVMIFLNNKKCCAQSIYYWVCLRYIVLSLNAVMNSCIWQLWPKGKVGHAVNFTTVEHRSIQVVGA